MFTNDAGDSMVFSLEHVLDKSLRDRTSTIIKCMGGKLHTNTSNTLAPVLPSSQTSILLPAQTFSDSFPVVSQSDMSSNLFSNNQGSISNPTSSITESFSTSRISPIGSLSFSNSFDVCRFPPNIIELADDEGAARISSEAENSGYITGRAYYNVQYVEDCLLSGSLVNLQSYRITNNCESDIRSALDPTESHIETQGDTCIRQDFEPMRDSTTDHNFRSTVSTNHTQSHTSDSASSQVAMATRDATRFTHERDVEMLVFVVDTHRMYGNRFGPVTHKRFWALTNNFLPKSLQSHSPRALWFRFVSAILPQLDEFRDDLEQVDLHTVAVLSSRQYSADSCGAADSDHQPPHADQLSEMTLEELLTPVVLSAEGGARRLPPNSSSSKIGSPTFPSPSYMRMPCERYSREEDLAILRYLHEIPARAAKTRGRILWQEMERLGVVNRSWQSLKNRFFRNIVPHCVEYSEQLPANFLRKLMNLHSLT